MAKKTHKQRHPLVKTLAYMLLVSAGLLVLAFIFIKIYTRNGKEYELPQYVGLNIEEAENNDLGLRFVIIDSLYNEGEEGGRILTQDPKAGTFVKKNRKVYVSINSYTPGNVLMPDFCNGQGLSSAISQLYSLGLQCGRLTFVEGDANLILAQSYKGRTVEQDAPIPSGSMIDLTVGKGAGAKHIVPQVIGKNPREARRSLLMESFNVGREHFKGVKNRTTAIVYKTEPPYTGISRYAQGTDIELWYKDSEGVDVRQMLRDYKIDSSKIIYEETPTTEEDVIEDSFWQF